MKHTHGSIEIITGSMFSGKTEELIRRLRRARIARQRVQVFKPILDTRYHVEKVTSHAGSEFEATPVARASDVLPLVNPETTVVALDEAQFFDDDVCHLAHTLTERNIRVIIAGLDQDFRGEPFGPMPRLIAMAEQVDKLHAICTVCGNEASRTQRLINHEPAFYDDPVVVVGASELYEARCRAHHRVPRRAHQPRPAEAETGYTPALPYTVLITEADLQARVRQLGAAISRDYAGKDLLLLCILRGGVMFLTDLMRAITIPHTIEFMAISSYAPGVRKSTGKVRINLDVQQDIAGRHVLVVEDIVDTGHTIAAVLDLLATRQPASLKICTLLDKFERREANVPIDYVGFTIPDQFVFGYGLDVDELHRNLPFVGVALSGG